MSKAKIVLWSLGLMAATTIGAGLFALPYVFKESGWFSGFFYLIAISGFLMVAHRLYWRVLEAAPEENSLLGLANKFLGTRVFYPSFLIVVGGLLLALVIYLILAHRFLALIFPGNGFLGVLVFWLLSSLPILFRLRRLVLSEIIGGACMALLIMFIFLNVIGSANGTSVPLVNLKNFFLPFGAVIFSLAGWTAIEPVFRYQKKAGVRAPQALGWGTACAALLYAIFTVAIVNSTDHITPDTFSGLAGWPYWKLQLLGWLGLFAIWTSYVPIGLEIKNSLQKDLRWPARLAIACVFFAPPLLIFLGFNNFIEAIGVAGGVFLSLQYLLIALIAKRVLRFTKQENFFVACIAALFLTGMLYELFVFVFR